LAKEQMKAKMRGYP